MANHCWNDVWLFGPQEDLDAVRAALGGDDLDLLKVTRGATNHDMAEANDRIYRTSFVDAGSNGNVGPWFRFEYVSAWSPATNSLEQIVRRWPSVRVMSAAYEPAHQYQLFATYEIFADDDEGYVVDPVVHVNEYDHPVYLSRLDFSEGVERWLDANVAEYENRTFVDVLELLTPETVSELDALPGVTARPNSVTIDAGAWFAYQVSLRGLPVVEDLWEHDLMDFEYSGDALMDKMLQLVSGGQLNADQTQNVCAAFLYIIDRERYLDEDMDADVLDRADFVAHGQLLAELNDDTKLALETIRAGSSGLNVIELAKAFIAACS